MEHNVHEEKGLSYLFTFILEKKALLLLACFFSIVSGILQIIPFVSVFKIVEEFFNKAQDPGLLDFDLVRRWGLIALLGLIAALVTLYVGIMCSHIAAFQILYSLRMKLVQHLTNTPMGYHTKTATGETKKLLKPVSKKWKNLSPISFRI